MDLRFLERFSSLFTAENPFISYSSIHTHVHTLMAGAVMQRCQLLISSNLGLSVSLKDTSTCSWGEPEIRTSSLAILDDPLNLLDCSRSESYSCYSHRWLVSRSADWSVGQTVQWSVGKCIFQGIIHESQRQNACSLRRPVSVSEKILTQIEIKIWVKRIPVSHDIGLVLLN